MTRQTWTTTEQREWLEERKPGFLEAKQNETTSKEFFPAVSKEFREKWPVPQVMDEEISKAGSIELASKIKREKYDKRIREWYHNNTRNLTSNVGSRGVLKIKGRPRVLQAWQAYQVLTYETQWKPLVSEEWDKYKNQWSREHPNEKPPKTRFSIMVEFIKDKFANETEEMKARCEELRKTLKEVSPVDEESAANVEFQLAIDKIPRTLAGIGESIAKQTGWHITILAGGPTPDLNGQIMTYLSHTGKTKYGRSFEKFLSPKEYDDHLLRPFEKFLHESFTEEDRDSRSRFKKRTADVGEEAKEMESFGEDSEDAEDDGDSEAEEVDKRREKRRAEFREYELNRQKNVEDLKKKLRAFKDELQVSAPKKLGPRPRKLASKKLIRDLDDEPVGPVRASQRNKHKSLTVDPAVPVATTSALVKPPSSAKGNPQPADESAQGDLSHLPPPIELATPPIELSDAADAALVDAAPVRSASPSALTSPASESVDPMEIAQTTSSVTSMPPLSDGPETALANSNTHVDPTPPSISSSGTSPGSEEKADNRGNTAYATSMPHGPQASHKPQNDQDLPPWLGLTIGYLRGVAEDVAWQDLVTAFVEFEKLRPSNGNLPTKCRPLQVSQWIKSKKKDVAPPVNPCTYGKQFMMWWTMMQPSWRTEGLDDSLVRQTPEGEKWEALRKGGTAGIYVVVMGLSWWVKAQRVVHDIDAWVTAGDILWVIEEMKKDMAVPMRLSTKRTREDEGDDDSEGATQQRKSRRLSQTGSEQCDAPLAS